MHGRNSQLLLKKQPLALLAPSLKFSMLFVVYRAVEAAVIIHAAGGVVNDVGIFCGLPRKVSISSLYGLKIYVHRQWEENLYMYIGSDCLDFGSLQ